MKTIFALCVLIGLLTQIAAAQITAAKVKAGASATAPAQNVPASQPAAGAAKGGELATLERKLLGAWKGASCAGDYTFRPDGTFECTNFTPGQNTLTGTWSIRWDALPPTLVLTCKTSDFKRKDPSRSEYEYLGKALELKLLELNRDTFVYRLPNYSFEWRNSRQTNE
jgi:hypothetical protein